MTQQTGGDDTMGALDWVLCILCSGIGCIVGIVYAVQGKPKGKMMIGISIAMIVVWNIIGFVVRSMGPH